MNWLKKILTGKAEREGRGVNLHAAEWEGRKRAMLRRLSNTPEGDELMVGLIGWQEQRLITLVRECDNRDITGEQALSLVHRIAETAAFREELELTWRRERERALMENESKR